MNTNTKLTLTRLLLAVVVLATVLAFVASGAVAHAADDPPELYEHINTGGDGNSPRIAVGNYTAQKFTSDDEAHSVTNIRLPLMRVGDPEYVTLELTTATSGNVSTGVVIADVTITTVLIPTDDYAWIDFDVSDSGASLDGNTSYVIVLSAPYGNLTNDYILWQSDVGGDGDDDTVGSHSTNAGVTWTLDTPTDYLFEIWGSGSLILYGANVFSDYIEDDDWIIVIEYENTYPPYYPSETVASYFFFQLLDLDGNITAETNVRMWEHRPGSIYLNADETSILEWGSAYTVRMIGNFGTEPYVDYVLTPPDWRGQELTLLDDWVIALAHEIADEEDELLTEFVADSGEVLNSRGQTIFAIGIPYLGTVRPDLMEMAVLSPMPTDKPSFSVTETDIETELGTELTGVLDDGRTYIGVEDTETMGGIVVMGVCGAALAVSAVFGHLLVGVALSYVALIAATVVGAVDWVYLGIVTFAIAVVWVYIHFSNR